MKKKVKLPLPLRVIKWTFPKIEAVSPWIAKRLFTKLFFRAFKYPIPEREQQFLALADSYTVTLKGQKIKVYEWGKGKPVLFVHGWMGRAGQFNEFIPYFTKKGFKCISFDAIGHGNSKGKSTNLLEISEIIRLIQPRYQHFEMIVGHSLGGVAVMHAQIEVSMTDKIALISSPSIADDILTEYSKGINASESNIEHLLQTVRDTVGMEFHDLEGSNLVQQLKGIDLLIFHDQDDSQVHPRHAEQLLSKYPDAKLVKTKSLGHNRILRDKHVIQVVHDYFNETEINVA